MGNRGLISSVAVHAALIMALWQGLPKWLSDDMMHVPPVMVVDILPITDITNVKPNPPKAKPEQKKPKPPKPEPEPEKPKEQPKPKEVEKPKEAPRPEPIPEPVKEPEKPKEAPKPKEQPKPEKPKEQAKPKPKSFDEILKNLANEASSDESQPDQPVAKNTTYDEARPLSIAQKDAIKQQLYRCWNPPAGVQDAHLLKLRLKLYLLPDGSVRDIYVSEQPNSVSRSSNQVAVDRAIRAVRMCSPLKGLPINNYAAWREIDMGFDPSEMLY